MPELNEILEAARPAEGALKPLLIAIAQHCAASAGAQSAEIWLWRVEGDDQAKDEGNDERRLELHAFTGGGSADRDSVERVRRYAELFPYATQRQHVFSKDGDEREVTIALGAYGYLTLASRDAALNVADVHAVCASTRAITEAIVRHMTPAHRASIDSWLSKCHAREQIIAMRLAEVRSIAELTNEVEFLALQACCAQSVGVYVLHPETARLQLLRATGLTDAQQRAANLDAETSHPGEVTRTGRAVILHEQLANASARSRMFTPIRVDGVVIGVLALTSTHENGFSSGHMHSIACLSEFIAIVYARIAAQFDAERGVLLNEALHAASERMLVQIDWRPLANAALAIMGSALDASAMALLELPPTSGTAQETPPMEFLWQPLFGLPWLHALRVREVANAERMRLANDRSVLVTIEGSAHQTLLIPVFAEGALWGVLAYEPRSDRAGALTRNDLTVLRSFAQTCGAVMTRERVDESMRKRQKIEAVGMLASCIAHDVNNRLWPILLYTELLESSPAIDERSKQMLHDMQHAARALGELVQQVLVISQRRDRVLELVPVAEVAIGIANILRSSAAQGITIKTAIDVDVGTVLGDAGSFHQALMNLATNAISAIQSNYRTRDHATSETETLLHLGTIFIEVVSEYRAGQRVIKVVVQDDGAGIDAVMREHLFEPYVGGESYDEGQRASGERPLVGLGLSVVHRIVTEMDGHITVDSAPGRGSRFVIVLPIVDTARVEEFGGTLAASPIHEANLGECVLFVDDDAVVLEVGQQMLESIGYQVIACSRALDAVAILADPTKIISLLLTDLTMPEMNGIQLARESKRLRPHLRIVCCTGFSDPKTETSAIEAGMSAVLRKPIHLELFAETLRRVIDEG